MRNFYDVFTTGKLGYLRVIAPQGLPTRLRLGFKFRGCWPGAVWGWWSWAVWGCISELQARSRHVKGIYNGSLPSRHKEEYAAFENHRAKEEVETGNITNPVRTHPRRFCAMSRGSCARGELTHTCVWELQARIYAWVGKGVPKADILKLIDWQLQGWKGALHRVDPGAQAAANRPSTWCKRISLGKKDMVGYMFPTAYDDFTSTVSIMCEHFALEWFTCCPRGFPTPATCCAASVKRQQVWAICNIQLYSSTIYS